MKALELLRQLRGGLGENRTALEKSRFLQLIDMFGSHINLQLESGHPVDLFEFFWYTTLCPEKHRAFLVRHVILEGEKPPDLPESDFWIQVLQELESPNLTHDSSLEIGKKLTALSYEWKDRCVHARRRSTR